MTERDALIFLNLLSIGYSSMVKLRDHFGSISNALSASEQDLKKVSGVRKTSIESICEKRSKPILDRELSLLERTGCHLITILDDIYPSALKQIACPPLVLYVRGELLPEDGNSIAVVGTRKPTQYGKQVAAEFSKVLAAQGVTIVSGLARGLDSAAHSGALEGGGRTVAILGSGLLRLYPKENEKLADAIEKNGAVISEFPLETKPFRSNFPIRNRIISGMSLGTLVVEASAKSGTLITAGFALEQGRSVFAVPGNIFSGHSEGVNNLIKQGAALVQNPDDIFRELSMLKRRDGNLETNKRETLTVKMSPDEKSVITFISDNPIHIDEITERSDMTAPEISVLLLTLEMKGIIKQLPGSYYVTEYR